MCVFLAISSNDKKDERSKSGESGSKSKFGFGLRKSVFSRKKDEKTPEKNMSENTGTLTKKKKDEEADTSTPKRGFGRLSFSRRKPKSDDKIRQDDPGMIQNRKLFVIQLHGLLWGHKVSFYRLLKSLSL